MDNTRLNAGEGGDLISTEELSGGVKIERVKVVNGAAGVDGGNVTTSNRFPVDNGLVQGLTDTQLRATAVPVSVAAGSDVTLGNTTDAAVVTDVNGTVSGKLRGLVKLLVDKITIKIDSGQTVATTIAAGADVTLGNTSDSAIITDTTGTVSGKLRGVVKILANVWDSATGHLNVDIDPESTTKDAFGRIRVSYPQVLGFGQSEYGINTNFIESAVNGAGAAVSSVVNEASIELKTGAGTSGNYAYAATRIFHRYVPGRSQLVRFTGSFAVPEANLRQRAGYFSSRNGFFLEYNGTTLGAVRRTYTGGSVSDVAIPRSSWYDKFDGTGPSGINMSFATGTTWLAWIDLEWLGVGRYRFGFASPTNGELLLAYAGAGTNSLTVPYMTTANLPVRYEIENTGATGGTKSMKWICYSVDTEGGDEGNIPVQTAIDNITGAAMASGTFRPILALRANTTGPNSVPNRAQIIVKEASGLVTGQNPVLFRLYLNPSTLTQAGGAVTWAAAGNLGQQASFTNAADTVSGGTIIESFFSAASAASRGTASSELYRRFPLVYTEMGSIQDTVVLAGAGVGGTSNNAYGALIFQEAF